MKSKPQNPKKNFSAELIITKPTFSLSYFAESKTVSMHFRIPPSNERILEKSFEMTVNNILEKGAHCLLIDILILEDISNYLKQVEGKITQLEQAGIEKIAFVLPKQAVKDSLVSILEKSPIQYQIFENIMGAKNWLS